MNPLPEAMRLAGEKIASTLMDAQISKCMNGLGGSKTWEEWIDEDIENKDLIVAYLEEKIVSVEAIFLAMQRAQKVAAVVVVEPDYWSGGHFHNGSEPYITYQHMHQLKIGTKLVATHD